MKNIIFLIAGFSALIVAPASARVGGPFDSGTFNVLMESGGTYQAILSFKNGSGFSYFSPDNALQPSLTTTSVAGGGAAGGGGSSNTTIQDVTLGLKNRSIVYYQGFTFVGMASGAVNTEAGFVTGNTNGSSEFGSTIATGTVGGGGGAVAGTVTIPIVQNSGTAYVASSSFEAKITTQIPSITFKGRGQISFISPDGFAASQAVIGAFVSAQFTTLATNAQTAGTTATTNFATATTPALTASSVVNQATPNVTNLDLLLQAIRQVTQSSTTPAVNQVAIDAALVTAATTGLTTQGTPTVNNTALNATLAGLNQINDNTVANVQNIVDQGVQAIRDAFKAPSLAEAAKNTDRQRMRVTGNLRYF